VDERYNQEYAYWQNRLRSRKQKLEDDFKREESERSVFYQNFSNNLQTPTSLSQNFQSYQRPMSPPQNSSGSISHLSPTSTSSYLSNPGSSQKHIYYSTINGNSSSSSSTHSNVLPTESVYSFNAHPENYMYTTHQQLIYQYHQNMPHHGHHQQQQHQTANNQR
jgi:hypothetical protein